VAYPFLQTVFAPVEWKFIKEKSSDINSVSLVLHA